MCFVSFIFFLWSKRSRSIWFWSQHSELRYVHIQRRKDIPFCLIKKTIWLYIHNIFYEHVQRMHFNRMYREWDGCLLLLHGIQVEFCFNFFIHTNLYYIFHIVLYCIVLHTKALEYESWIKWNLFFFHCLATRMNLSCNTQKIPRIYIFMPKYTCSIFGAQCIFWLFVVFFCKENNLSIYWNFNVKGIHYFVYIKLNKRKFASVWTAALFWVGISHKSDWFAIFTKVQFFWNFFMYYTN